MATRKAPGARGRGRTIVLASVLFAVLISSVASVSPAFASGKGKHDPGSGESAPAETSGSTGQVRTTTAGSGGAGRESSGSQHRSSGGNGDHGAPKQSAGAECAPQTGGSGAGGSTGDEGSIGQPDNAGTVQGPIDKDGEPNKPPSEKYNGPCTRHEDPPGNGTGHDWHRGEGKGHDGTPSDEPTDPGDGGQGGGGGTTPGGPVVTPTDGSFLPYTAQPVSVVTVRTSTTEDDLPDYLPYTGGESDLLLAVAACVGMLGIALRGRSWVPAPRRRSLRWLVAV